MTIPGFERAELVRDHIGALERELSLGIAGRQEAIQEQLAIFRAEAERMEREGEAEPPSPYVVRPEGATTWR
jgi:hypothetical protein